MRRIYRNAMSQSQKDKLSAINKGKTLPQSTKDKISQSMTKYWSSLPYKPDTDGGTPPPPTPPSPRQPAGTE